MKDEFAYEIVISSILIFLIIVFLNPLEIVMAPPLFMALIVILIVVFGIFATMFWRESAKDERERMHKMMAGRIGFLVGAGVLVLAIIVQSFNHKVDVWLVLTLGAMIVAKMFGIIYSRLHN